MPRSLLEMKRRYSPIRSFECNRCSEPAAHRHHIDRDRKNNADSNIELLCNACHAEEHERARHGTFRMYSYYKCRCDRCRVHWNTYYREYKRKKRAHSKATKALVRSEFKGRAEALRLQGYSYNEIAQELDCTRDQAWSYVNG